MVDALSTCAAGGCRAGGCRAGGHLRGVAGAARGRAALGTPHADRRAGGKRNLGGASAVWNYRQRDARAARGAL